MPLKLYDMPRSGHSHRVRLLLSFLGVEYERVAVDMPNAEHKAPEYLKLSPLGQVPTLVDGDIVVTDSTAALVYLAKKYKATNWLPEDPAGAAAVQRWLSAASGELYRSVVQSRAGRQYRRDVDFERAAAEATRLFKWMQSELDQRTWLAADHATIADVAMYSYLRVADEGKLDLADYPAITRWLADVEKLERFEPMVRQS